MPGKAQGIVWMQVDTSSAGRESQWGTGGMTTKLTAARIATAAACTCVISSSSHSEAIPGIVAGKRHQAGTLFHPLPNAVRLVHYGCLPYHLACYPVAPKPCPFLLPPPLISPDSCWDSTPPSAQ